MELKKLKEIAKFYIGPMNELRKNRNLRMKSYYVNMINKKAVRNNTFLLESYHAVSMTGNVYALFTELLDEAKLADAEFYWATTDLNNPMIKRIQKKYSNYKNIHFVEYESKKYFYLLATCQYLINDTSFLPYFIKRDDQIYINTWHGTPLKTLGLDIKNATLSSHKNIQRNFLQSDYMFMPNRFTADRLIKGHDLNGILNSKVYITGNPRVDLTLSTDKAEIIQLLNLPRDKKLVLYAPTWKKDLEETTEEDILQLLKEVEQIQKSLGENYKVLLKAHYFIYDYFVEHNLTDKIIPNWIDTNELLTCIDKLITDYSSIFFDFLPTKRSIYFYIPDKEVYEETRGFYLDLNELPGILCTTISELCQSLSIEDSDYKKQYKKQYDRYLKDFCLNDDNHSRSRVVDILFRNNKNQEKEISYLSNKKKLLFYCGGFYNNGITNSAINLSKKIDYDKYDVVFIDTDRMNKEKSNNIQRVDSRVHFIYKFSGVNRGYMNTIRQNLLYRQGLDTPYVNKEKLEKHLNYEYKRIVGKLPVDVLIDFGGYNKMFNALFAFAEVPRKVVYLHNVMMEEYNKKISNKYKHKWNLKVIFSLYSRFDKIISVSESANERNELDLGNQIKDYKNKMDYVNNSIDGDSILQSIHNGESYNRGNNIYSSDDNQPRKVFLEETDQKTGITTLKGFIPPNSSKVNFVNIARLSPEKNHIALVTAFEKILRYNRDCELFILGEGPSRTEIEKKIFELGISKNVHLMGHLSHPAMFLNLCDCFVLSSNYEGQGLVLLEAMIVGKPVIGTDVPGIHSVLENTNGLLVENSVEAIYQGLKKFVNGDIQAEKFDYVSYNEAALNDFYKKVCGD